VVGSGHGFLAGDEIVVINGENASFSQKLGGYVALTKPRIIELLLITTVPAMVVANEGFPSVRLMIATVIGGAFAAGGASAVNMIVDRDIDARMVRTAGRPLVTGVVQPRAALVFALCLEVIAALVLGFEANWLAAGLALAAAAFYVGVYTLWLKRRSPQNIVIGGAAGAVPALVGWSAVTGDLAWTPIVMFVLVFLWTPPHFWALAIRHADDYSRADVPMLPSVATESETTRQILLYTFAVLATSFLLIPIASLGLLYSLTALGSGALFLLCALALHLRPSDRAAMRMFGFSITYLTVLFVAMAADVVLRAN
jgi:protoheme IX farnesyltransferase